jgi:hypothetical protein
MRRRLAPLLALALVVATTGCAIKGDLNKDNVALEAAFTEKLLDRLRFYHDGAAALDAKVRQAPPPVDAEGVAKPGPPDNATAELFYGSFELHAHADLLDHFLHEATKTGQTATMTAWLNERSARLATSVAMTDQLSAQFRTDAIADPNNPTLPKRYFELLLRRGSERGMHDEIATLQGDVASYASSAGGGREIPGPMAPDPPLP